MNKEKVLELCANYIVDSEFTSDIDIRDVFWKVQEVQESGLLFLKKCPSEFINLANSSDVQLVITDCDKNFTLIKKNKIKIKQGDWLKVQKIFLDIIYPYPQDINLIGVTGTNGKTTVVNFMEQILLLNKKNVVSCGTLGLFVNGAKQDDFSLTTPSFIDIRKIIYKYKDNINFLFEVSSHALSQERFFGITFNEIGWTSFSQDHLDFHGSMEEYFNEKLKLKNYSNENIKIPFGESSLENEFKSKNIKYDTSKKLDFSNCKNNVFEAEFNKKNYMLAVGLLSRSLGTESKTDFLKIKPVPGRFELIPWRDNYWVIDFAHTPDALENISKEIKKTYKDFQLFIVFGCGGDRDSKKRPIMARIAEKYGDKIFLTSDNPRFENPEDIINDAKKGFENLEKVIIESDRREAILIAKNNIKSPTVILVAGKGHEKYLDIKGVKHSYSDKKVIKDLIRG